MSIPIPARAAAAAFALAAVPHAFAAEEVTFAPNLPVTEVTVFKDGHAFVLHEGEATLDDRGDVVLAGLPQPVLGTFWAVPGEDGPAIASLRAGTTVHAGTRDVASIAELLRANPGRRVTVTTADTNHAGILRPSITDDLVVIEEEDGDVRVLPAGRIRDVRFEGADAEVARLLPQDETRRRLVVDLDHGAAGPAGPTAPIGLMYLEQGFRWIPSYRVDLIGDDVARVSLQATLVNDLVDLENATANLVIGVPTFAFAGRLDPIALRETVAQIGAAHAGSGRWRQVDQLSNALRSQVAFEPRGYEGANPDPGASPELEGAEGVEDLFVHTVSGVTLAKGERLVVPIATVDVPCESVYRLDLPVAPPAPAWQQIPRTRHAEIAQQLERPTARKVIRLRNTGDGPFTTAPALVLRNGRPVAQSLMTYVARGGSGDLELTAGVDLRVDLDEREAERDTDGIRWNGNTYARIDLAGGATITNYRDEPIRLELSRRVFGTVDGVTGDGAGDVEVRGVSVFSEHLGRRTGQWWREYGWPWWWGGLNGASELRWTLELEPGATAEVAWTWHYFWR